MTLIGVLLGASEASREAAGTHTCQSPWLSALGAAWGLTWVWFLPHWGTMELPQEGGLHLPCEGPLAKLPHGKSVLKPMGRMLPSAIAPCDLLQLSPQWGAGHRSQGLTLDLLIQ